MAQLMLINPHKRRKARVSANPKRRVHRRKSVARVAAPKRRIRRNPIHALRRHHSRRRVHRNPIGGIGGQIMDAGVGAAGAVLADVVQGYLPIPASMQTGYGPYLVKGALGLGMGMFRNRTLKKMGAGALLVAAYGALKQASSGLLPAPAVAGMGYMSPTPQVMSQYITGPGSGMAGMAGMGEYIPEGAMAHAGFGFH
jgi:hypothetical protein